MEYKKLIWVPKHTCNKKVFEKGPKSTMFIASSSQARLEERIYYANFPCW